MDPLFRVMTVWDRSLDEAVYDCFPKNHREDWWMEGILCLASALYLVLQLFVWGLRSMKPWQWFFLGISILLLIFSVRMIHERKHSRERYLNEQRAKRKAKSAKFAVVTAVLFYSDHLVQYDLNTGTAQRLDYEDVTGIRYRQSYIFLLNKSDMGMICLEKEGFSGKYPRDAVRWLAVRCNCKLPKKK